MLPWSQSSLLLVAHGSSSYPDAVAGLYRLAETLRQRQLFERVDLAFWRQQPALSADMLQGRQIFVLPFFAGLGKHTEELIPERLGLHGAVTRRDEQIIYYCQPVGCHPGLPALIAEHSAKVCQDHQVASRDAALLLIAHGSRSGGASKTPLQIAESLAEIGTFAEIVTVFLEQEPYARDWPGLVRSAQIVAQPLLLSAGMHASEDLPALFSAESCRGRQVWLQSGIGSDDQIITLMLQQIERAS